VEANAILSVDSLRGIFVLCPQEDSVKQRVLRNLTIVLMLVGLFSVGAATFGQQVSKVLHPNLAAAQGFIERAINRVAAAQKANEFDMSGHAAKAKAFLDQAYAEIKLAAETANAKK
jgi:hypothetical protein